MNSYVGMTDFLLKLFLSYVVIVLKLFFSILSDLTAYSNKFYYF